MLTLANCTAFQEWVGAATEDAAKTHIYFDFLPTPTNFKDSHGKEELESYRPYARIWTPDRGGGYALVRDAAEGWIEMGTVLIDLYQDIPEGLANSPSEAFRTLKNIAGRIMSEASPNVGLVDLAHTAPDDDHTYLAFDKLTPFGPFRASEEEASEQGDYAWMQLTLDWGRRQQ